MSDTKPPIDPKDLKPLMYWAGLSFQACQQFEYGIKLLLVVMAETGFGKTSMPEAVAIIEDQHKKTLGQLLRLLKEKVTISEGWSAVLEAGLDARNNIIHQFLLDNTERIVDPGTRPAVLADLKQLRNSVLAGDQTAREIIKMIYAYQGIDFAEMNRGFWEEVQALNDKRQESNETLEPTA